MRYTVDGYQLGVWVNNQRARWNRLDADRQHRLEDLPGWTWDSKASQWEEGFSHLSHYVERNGDARVRRSATDDGYPLGRWVQTQRSHHTEGTLEADREHRLEELSGWTWDPHADRWEEGFRRLKDYVKRHRDARVPVSYTDDGYPLGKWVVKQRYFHNEGTLEADCEHRLVGLSGWTWDPHADRWEEGFRRLKDYVKRHRDARVPRSYTDDGYRLGSWVTTQRQSHRKGTLDDDREQRLQDLPGWTWKASSST